MRRGALIGALVGAILTGLPALGFYSAYEFPVDVGFGVRVGYGAFVTGFAAVIGLLPGAFLGLTLAWACDRKKYGPVAQWSIIGTIAGFVCGSILAIFAEKYFCEVDCAQSLIGLVFMAIFVGYVCGAFFGAFRNTKQERLEDTHINSIQ